MNLDAAVRLRTLKTLIVERLDRPADRRAHHAED